MRKKRRGSEERSTVADLISQSFELPVNVVEGLPEMNLLGNREAVIEHCQGILEYDDKVVRVNTGKLIIKFTGRGLQLKSMTESGVVVAGYFTAIEFMQ